MSSMRAKMCPKTTAAVWCITTSTNSMSKDKVKVVLANNNARVSHVLTKLRHMKVLRDT